MYYIYSHNQHFKSNINIESVLNAVDSNKELYSNVQNYEYYIDNWKRALLDSYFLEKKVKRQLMNDRFFYESMFFDYGEIRLHFNIDKAICFAHQLRTETVPISLFSEKTTPTSTIKYSKPSSLNNISEYALNKEPILIVNFLITDFTF